MSFVRELIDCIEPLGTIFGSALVNAVRDKMEGAATAAAFEIEGVMVDGPNGPYDFLADVCTGQWLGFATLDQHPFGKFAGFNEDDNKMDMSATAVDLELNGGPSLEECIAMHHPDRLLEFYGHYGLLDTADDLTEMLAESHTEAGLRDSMQSVLVSALRD